MRKLRALWQRVCGIFIARRLGEELDAELEAHLVEEIGDGIHCGLSEAEARREALVRMGGVEQVRQAYRDRATLPWVESILRDVRYALRGFGRNPVFAITAILTLALGIGATTAVFSVVDRILFRPLPFAHDDRLVSVGLAQPLQQQEFTLGFFYYEWRDNQKPFQDFTFERGVSECNLTESNPLHIECGTVAQNFLSALGVRLEAGRNFLPEEDVPNGPRSVIISDGLWLSRFNRDPGALNKSIAVDDHEYRIVGVLPRNFEMPRLQAVDVLMPAQMDLAAQHTLNAGIGLPMWAFARLKPGVSVAEAKAQMEPLFLHTQQWIPPEIRKGFYLQVRSLRDLQMHNAYLAAKLLLGAVFAVLLIACANVASLLSARRAARARDLAVRSALGASRARIVLQGLVESFILAGAGAALGSILAELLVHLFVVIAPSGIPFLDNARIDLRVILLSLLVAGASALVAGGMPLFEKPGTDGLVSRAGISVGRARLRNTLVAFQIAVSVILLAGATLLVKSFRNLQAEHLGFETRGVMALDIPLTSQRYPTAQQSLDFFLRAERGLRSTPGVTRVAISDSIPPDGNSWHHEIGYSEIFADGRQAAANGTGGKVIDRTITPEYFRVLGIPIVAGHDFTEEDRTAASNPMIVSQMLAARLFPGEDPVGKHFQFGTFQPYFSLDKQVFTVIGVAANAKNAGLAGEDVPEYYELLNDRRQNWGTHAIVLLQTALPVSTIAPWVRARIAQIDPNVPVKVTPLSETVSRLADRPRFETALLTFFAFTGLVMAIIGLYGVVAFMAAQRTQEIGIRMALGATRGDVMQLILREGFRLIVIGGALGLAAALGLSRVLGSVLFGVSPHDPISFGAVTVLLALVALIAILIPARSAMKTDPITALRCE
jgi:putative ABC transport system permease protein